MNADQSVVLYELEGSVARVTLNRPEKRNALNDAVIAGLKENLKKAAADKNIRVVVIAGAGKDFCSGADLSALQKIAGASVAENSEDARSVARIVSADSCASGSGRCCCHGSSAGRRLRFGDCM
jgi:methylglutaconyl-CoA hydratase